MMAELVSRALLRVRQPFAGLFAIDPEKRAAILAHMRAHGFDRFEGIDAWQEPDGILTVVDGHTRLSVAAELGIERVPINRYAFADDLDALRHAIHKQRDRRNLTAAEMMRGVMAVDAEFRKPGPGGTGANQYTKGGMGSLEPIPPSAQRSAERTAEVAGVSESTVKRVRAIADQPDVVAAVERGEMNLLDAATEARSRRSEREPTVTENDHNPKRPHDGLPWFDAKNLGHEVAATITAACNEVELLIARGGALDLPALMADRRVSPRWNEAVREARRLSRLVREAIAADEPE